MTCGARAGRSRSESGIRYPGMPGFRKGWRETLSRIGAEPPTRNRWSSRNLGRAEAAIARIVQADISRPMATDLSVRPYMGTLPSASETMQATHTPKQAETENK